MTTASPDATLHSPLLSDRFRPVPHVAWVQHAGVTVVLDVERGLYFTLNEVGSRIWELLVAGEPLIEILRALEDEFEVSPAVLPSDTAVFFDRLVHLHLIERIQP